MFENGFVFDADTVPLPAVQPKRSPGKNRVNRNDGERGCDSCPLSETWDHIHSPQMKLYGDSDADILVLGEAPGEEEDKEGRPFIGRAGRLLDKVMSHRHRDRLAMANAVRCHPAHNRTPTGREVHCCSIHLENDIANGRYKAILGLGQVPLSRFIDGDATITHVHGLKFPVQIAGKVLWYYPTLHPAFVLRSGGDRAEQNSPMLPILQNDLNRFFARIDKWKKPVIEAVTTDKVICAYTEDEARGWCAKLRLAGKPVGFDIETNGLRPNVVGAAILTAAVSNGERTVAWPVRHPQMANDWGLPLLFEMTQNLRWIAHNAAFELAWLYEHAQANGIDWIPDAGFDDSMIAARLFQRRETCLNLGVLTRLYTGTNIKKLSNINPEKMAETSLEDILPYNGLDAWGSWRIHKLLYPYVNPETYDSIRDTVASVTEMQLLGLDIDQDAVKQLNDEWTGRAEAAAAHSKTVYEVKQYERQRQREFNIGSNDQVAEALIEFGNVTLTATAGSEKEGAKQRYTVDDTVLSKLDSPLAADVLEYRHAKKMVSTYVEPLVLADTRFVDHRIHPVYSTMLTKTLRLSCEDPNCFPGYVEVLTNQGWQRWDQVAPSALLAQWDAGTVSFAQPLELGSYLFDGDLIRITTEQHLDIICTPNHRFLTRDGRCEKDFRREVTAASFPKSYDIPLAGFYEGGSKTLREPQLILAAAFQADAYWPTKSGAIEWGLTRKRKIERLRTALQAENITFTEKLDSLRDRTRFFIPRRCIPDWLPEKRHFGPWTLSLTASCLTFLAEELWLWDGGVHRNDFCTGDKNDADWAQIILTLTGRAATVRKRMSGTAGNSFFVTARNIAHAATANHTKEFIPYQGLVYCATMPKGTLIVRHNNRAIIAMNCQNFPARKDRGLRRPIVPPAGCVWASADYGQLEARVYGMASRDRALCDSLIAEEDIHSYWLDIILREYPPYMDRLATKVTPNDTVAQIRKGGRDIIKSDFVFASFFGTTAKNVAERTSIPLEIATEVLARFWRRYATAYDWLKAQRKDYFNTGSTRNLCGVERYGIMTGNEPINTPIQSTAARLVLEAQNEMHQWSKRVNDPHLMPRINIHDDLTFALPDDPELLPVYMEEISKVLVKLRFRWQIVPLKVEWKTGHNWAELKNVYQYTGEYRR